MFEETTYMRRKAICLQEQLLRDLFNNMHTAVLVPSKGLYVVLRPHGSGGAVWSGRVVWSVARGARD